MIEIDLKLLNQTIHFLDAMAATLDDWAINSRVGVTARIKSMPISIRPMIVAGRRRSCVNGGRPTNDVRP